MNIQNNMVFTGLLGLLTVSVLLVGCAQTATRGGEGETRDAPKGYISDSSGNIWRDSAGNCWHSGSWTPADATVVGCDGVELDASAQVIRGEGTGIAVAFSFPAASMFAFDSAELTDEGKTAIDDHRSNLEPDLSEAYLVLIVGHTDSTGDAGYNQNLSLQRAESVAGHLTSTGVSTDILRVLGRGSTEPLASNENSEGRAENRRVDVVVVGDERALDTMLFPSAALFERRSGDLTVQGKELLDKNVIAAIETLRRASFIEIVGHTDDVGDDDYNMKLSEQRAQSVRDYLVSNGVDSSKIVTTAKGESSPIASNNTPEGRTENRRVQIRLLGRIKE